mmetsp:Transcript_27911/g.53120  ORF Transcript_27911/g.53120 Transcript_27911/m.53120 type:complete len:397 (+) Transcript_27911:376-1566(+)
MGSVLGAELHEHVPQTRQALVDGLGLLQALTVNLCPRRLQALRSGQINQVEHPIFGFSRGGVVAFQAHAQYAVAARGGLIHQGRSGRPCLHGAVVELLKVLGLVHFPEGDVRDGGAPGGVVGDGVLPPVAVPKQIPNLLVVYLQHVHHHAVLPALGLVRLHGLEDLLQSSRDDASVRLRPQHGEGLARARLPVGEDAHAVAVHRALHQLRGVRVQLLLARRRLKHGVKGEGLGSLLAGSGLVPLAVEGDALALQVAARVHEHVLRLELLRAHGGTHAHKHADLALHVQHLVQQLRPHRFRRLQAVLGVGQVLGELAGARVQVLHQLPGLQHVRLHRAQLAVLLPQVLQLKRHGRLLGGEVADALVLLLEELAQRAQLRLRLLLGRALLLPQPLRRL